MLARCIVLILLLVAVQRPATAQTVEYEIPSEYDLVPGRLAVTFVDSVSEGEARALLKLSGDYDLVRVHFPLRFVAERPGQPSTTMRAELLADSLLALTRRLPPASSVGPFRLHAEATVSESTLRRHLRAAYGLRLRSLQRRTGEIILAVPDEDAETTIGRLEQLPGVKYVTFLVADGE